MCKKFINYACNLNKRVKMKFQSYSFSHKASLFFIPNASYDLDVIYSLSIDLN